MKNGGVRNRGENGGKDPGSVQGVSVERHREIDKPVDIILYDER